MKKKTRRVKDLVWKILNFMKIGGIVEISKTGGLKEDGWYKSFHEKKSIDYDGYPIPWFTYPAIKFLETRLNLDLSILEYGAGNSTLWFSPRVKSVTSIEHSESWYKVIKSSIPQNCELHYVENNPIGNYSGYLEKLQKNYDIIIIDGIERVECCKVAPLYLSENGIIILDNSEIELYSEGKQHLSKLGFREITFEGNLPIVSHHSSTSFFYRNNNIFNI